MSLFNNMGRHLALDLMVDYVTEVNVEKHFLLFFFSFSSPIKMLTNDSENFGVVHKFGAMWPSFLRHKDSIMSFYYVKEADGSRIMYSRIAAHLF